MQCFRPVQDVIENSRMHIVAKTGQEEMAALQPINGSEMIANRFPLIVNGEISRSRWNGNVS